MLGLIEIVFSSIGVYGYFTQNLICVILGLIGIIVCDSIDIFVTGHNPTIVFLAITFGIGVSIANKNPLYGFTIALCGENLIMSLITIFIMGISFIVGYFKKDEYKYDSVIFDLMKESNLSYKICKDICKIVIEFKNGNIEDGYTNINSQLIPDLKEEGNITNVGIAFGMLIDDVALSKEESTEYSQKVIKEILLKQNFEENV